MKSDIRDIVATCCTPGFWAAAEADTMSRVGTLLVLINQGNVILGGQVPPLWKLTLTCCVPYGVSTYSAASFEVSPRRSREPA